MNTAFLTVYWRDMIRFRRFKPMLFSTLVQPILWMAFFGIGMSSNFDRFSQFVKLPPGIESVDYLTFMAAGVIAMTTLFTSLFGGISLLFDKRWGIMKEMLASPMPRTHILWGISLSGVTKALIQAALIMSFGLLIGVKFFSGYSAVEVLISLLGIAIFVTVFSLGFLFLSAGITMRLESMEGVQGIMTLLTMPLFFSSSALYPVEGFPSWLRAISVVNPLTYLVKGIRYFAIGEDFFAMGTHYTYSIYDVLLSLGFLTIFALLTYLFAWVTFRRAVVT
ncbi:MAG: ABC transporter permease [Thermoplasmata archaeon]|nr:ABC transporter permease [Thermoplasmata archaeon]RLF55845.1 MAG: multidrug ABC transporter permease [Thermoplasmata archaeon]RLF71427.1 MAG: multidrug ABC transporter permease [Thermoplasmata archaeon]RLF73758.1 MAG: multidrug ABC transporter permease [Thermoplasmata archaeon]HDD60783.1 multidrug ABC transporter permease [Euryarchaeota archaeon]